MLLIAGFGAAAVYTASTTNSDSSSLDSELKMCGLEELECLTDAVHEHYPDAEYYAGVYAEGGLAPSDGVYEFRGAERVDDCTSVVYHRPVPETLDSYYEVEVRGVCSD